MQNQDFTVIQDYCTGLKSLLYLKANPPPHNPSLWEGQSPPTIKTQRGKPVDTLRGDDGKTLTHFGPYQLKRDTINISKLQSSDPVTLNQLSQNTSAGLSGSSPSPSPSVRDVIGLSLPYIGSFKQMDNKKQVVALIDDVSVNK